jgi:hypothetical protein
MSAIYQLRTYTPAGVLTSIITDYLQLAYVREVNGPGMCQFVLNADHAAIANFALDAQVEVWRADTENGIAWYCDYYGFWRGEQRRADSDGTSTYTAYCVGQMSLLARAIVAYPAHTNDRSSFNNSKAETTAKLLVTYHATSAGTTGDGRIRDVTLAGITVQADGATGDTFDYNCAWRNLLASLQEVAQVGGGDFDLIKTGAQAWEFRWYNGQRGTDRSATITFALQYGNMANPVLTRNSMDEKTVAIVGGQGEEASRTVVVRTGANYEAIHNAIETFVQASSYSATDGLNTEGDRELDTLKRRDVLTFDVLQIPSTRYGLHYGLGDLVTGYYQGITATKKIQRVTVSLDTNGEESIRVELTDV